MFTKRTALQIVDIDKFICSLKFTSIECLGAQ